MTSRIARPLLIALLAGAAVAVSLTASLGADYPAGPCPRACDYAGPPISALIHGDFHKFFSEQPLMGPFSLLLRAPFAALASALHGGELWEYRLGVLACLCEARVIAYSSSARNACCAARLVTWARVLTHWGGGQLHAPRIPAY